MISIARRVARRVERCGCGKFAAGFVVVDGRAVSSSSSPSWSEPQPGEGRGVREKRGERGEKQHTAQAASKTSSKEEPSTRSEAEKQRRMRLETGVYDRAIVAACVETSRGGGLQQHRRSHRKALSLLCSMQEDINALAPRAKRDGGRSVGVAGCREGVAMLSPKACGHLMTLCGDAGAVEEVWEIFKARGGGVRIVEEDGEGEGMRRRLAFFGRSVRKARGAPTPRPNIVHYGTALYVCAAAGQADRAWAVLREMVADGSVYPSVRHYNAVMKACGKAGQLKRALFLLAEMQTAGGQVRPDNFTLSIAMQACIEAGECDKALGLLEEEMRLVATQSRGKGGGIVPDRVSFNTAIHACAKAGKGRRAVHILHRLMPEAGVLPDAFSYNTAMTACVNSRDYTRALDLFNDLRRGGRGTEEREGGGRGLTPDAISYNTAMRACGMSGQGALALELFREMKDERHLLHDTVSYNTVIHACGAGSHDDEAMELIQEMRRVAAEEGQVAAAAAAAAAALHAGREEKRGSREGRVGPRVPVQRVSPPDERTYNGAMWGSSKRGDVARVLSTLEEMKREGLRPDSFSHAFLARAFAAAGRYEESLNALADFESSMRAGGGAGEDRRLGITEIATRCAVMKACGAAGRFDLALGMFEGLQRASASWSQAHKRGRGRMDGVGLLSSAYYEAIIQAADDAVVQMGAIPDAAAADTAAATAATADRLFGEAAEGGVFPSSWLTLAWKGRVWDSSGGSFVVDLHLFHNVPTCKAALRYVFSPRPQDSSRVHAIALANTSGKSKARRPSREEWQQEQGTGEKEKQQEQAQEVSLGEGVARGLVITGRGQRSAQGISVLQVEVTKFLREELGCKVQPCTEEDAGAFVIEGGNRLQTGLEA